MIRQPAKRRTEQGKAVQTRFSVTKTVLAICFSGLPIAYAATVMEIDALEALYAAIDGANWTINSNWLVRTRPAELDNLTTLQFLYLNKNQLSGPIPTELGNLFNLDDLNLGFNQLTCPIPAGLGSLANVFYLNLGWSAL